MKSRWMIVSFLGLAMMWAACDDGRNQDQLDRAGEKLEQAGEKLKEGVSEGVSGLADAIKDFGKEVTGKDIEPIDYRELKKVLPSSMRGMDKVDDFGENNAMLGMKMSRAEAEFKDGKAYIKVQVTDWGTLNTLARIADFAWTKTNINRESDNGWERTMEYRDYRGYEKYDKRDEKGQLKLVVADRFIVDVEGRQVSMRDIKKAADRINYRALERMKEFSSTD